MQTVVVSAIDGQADKWANQFVDVFKNRPKKVEMGGTLEVVPPRHNVNIPKNANVAKVIETIKTAVKLASTGGTLVFNVGHGGIGKDDTSSADGFVDLAPGKILRLSGLNSRDKDDSFISVFFDLDIDGSGPGMSDLRYAEMNNPKSAKLERWKQYKDLSDTIKAAKLRKVVFLTCRVGGATDFIRKIALDWGTIVEAYLRQVALQQQANGRVRIFLFGDSPDTGTNVASSEENLFSSLAGNNMVLVGPPS